MTYLYSKVNGIDASRIMTHKQYMTITPQTRETLRPVLVDDAIYSGAQMRTKAETINHPRTTVATLSSYNEFAQYMDKQRREFDHNSLRKTILDAITFRTKPSKGPISDLVTLQTDISLGEPGMKISSRKSIVQNEREDLIRGDLLKGGFADIESLKVFPYMTSDTSPYFVRDFGLKVLKVRSGN